MDDKTQAFDPNRTQIGGPNLNATQAMTSPPSAVDPNRTAAFEPPKPIQVTITPSREAAMANGPGREQFLLEIDAPSEPGLTGVVSQGQRTPLNLCLCIDRSGSMEGTALMYAKEACKFVVDMLGPDDVLSIVVFEETVEVLMAPQRVTDKETVKMGINQLTAGMTTNLSDGLTLSAQQLTQNIDPSRATRMVVLSDGEPTAGIKDFPSLVALVGDVRAKGITCTFLGLGAEFNEELLAAMAKKAGGNYYYVAEPHVIPEIFRAELEKLGATGMTGAKLDIKLSRWVTLRGLTGHNASPGQREVSVDLADLERGSTLQIVLDLEFNNHPLGFYRVAEGRLEFADSSLGSHDGANLDFIMEFTADSSKYSAAVNPVVAAAAQTAAASRTVEKTIMGLKTQALTPQGAIAELQKTQALLMNQGRSEEAREVTLAMQAIQRGDASGAEKTLMGTMVNLDQGKTDKKHPGS